MPTLLNYIPSSPTGGQYNPSISADITFFDKAEIIGGSHYNQALVSSTPLHTLNKVRAVPKNIRSLDVYMAKSYGDDYFQGIHISPAEIDLGNVISAQTETVYLWNAESTSQTLNSITGQDDGLELSGQASPPLLFHPREEKSWDLSITPQGAAVIDSTLQWLFSTHDQAQLSITGNRIVAFSWLPDWNTPVTETLSWLTDILQSESAVEQRRALRLMPRRTFSFTLFAEGVERRRLELALFSWSGRAWALPIYADAQRLTTSLTAGSTYIDCTLNNNELSQVSLALLRGADDDSYEVVEIASTNETGINLSRETQINWPVGTHLYPLRSARLTEMPTLTRLNDDAALIRGEINIQGM